MHQCVDHKLEQIDLIRQPEPLGHTRMQAAQPSGKGALAADAGTAPRVQGRMPLRLEAEALRRAGELKQRPIYCRRP